MSSTLQIKYRIPFIDYLKFEKRYSKHTITAYETDLDQFFNFIEKQYQLSNINDLSSSMVRTWLASLKEDKLTSKSINRKISSLKSLNKYLLKNGLIEKSPMSSIVSPKISKRLPQFIEEQQLKTLFEHVEFTEDWKQQTEKMVLELFYNTGMRLSELINLKQQQIDFSNQQLKVFGKGNKERIIPLSETVILHLNNYISNNPTEEKVWVFVSEKGKTLNPRYVYGFVKKYLSLITTVNKKSPHILRHSFATHLMNNGAEINAVKELLGHSSLAATQVYTHNSIEKLKEVFKKAHPKA
ncbi:MAG: tyrosine-type recombinase/integrase [Chitinophagaceae bacterium]|nr:tyrosine-type recombinase/integrase [Chitinophagaceae bacterium]